MNDAVVILCGVILLVAILPMILMNRAFRGAGNRKEEGGGGAYTAGAADRPGKDKGDHGQDDSGGQGGSDGGDGGGAGE
ncbi:MAG: hypothetical protein Q8R82_15250 [Hyphomonadaceae bacterium]|nr:hypothetical protein [Hyphomonadaceae bacterium]